MGRQGERYLLPAPHRVALQPFVPHISEELWRLIGGRGLAVEKGWPKFNITSKESSYSVVIQINGKVRDLVLLDSEASKQQVVDLAAKSEKIKKNLHEKEIMKVVYVPNKVLNFVIK